MKRRQFVVMMAGAVPGGAALAMPTPWMRARQRALQFLVRRQSEDGAWRSHSYGSFKTGDGLTPLVLNAAWPGLSAERREAAVRWLVERGEKVWKLFPVHNAGWLLELGRQDPKLASLAPLLSEHLRTLQLGSALGWEPGHRYHGGWSYAGMAARKVAGRDLAPMQEPNLSATVLAVAGLRNAGTRETDPILEEAARFISRCQNLGSEAGDEFDDGGFFQMAGDISRNKAGVAGRDGSGRRRFRSYFSATADGVRGLLMCGVDTSDRRVVAGLRWLDRQTAVDDVPDLTFYTGYARHQLAQCLGERPQSVEPELSGAPLQNADGSYANSAGEMRENEPLVATSLRLMSLAMPNQLIGIKSGVRTSKKGTQGRR